MSVAATIINHPNPERIQTVMSKNMCPTKKHRHRDHREAVEALHSAKNSAKYQLEIYGETQRQECRTYRCKLCKGWHTTSQPQKNKQVNVANPKKAVSR
jgi:hypothetical protein